MGVWDDMEQEWYEGQEEGGERNIQKYKDKMNRNYYPQNRDNRL